MPRGVHLDLTGSLRGCTAKKTARLLWHHDRIIRMRVDLEHDATAAIDRTFVAKGHIEIGGPDLLASAADDDLDQPIGQMVVKLSRLLRSRHDHFVERPHGGRSPAVALQRRT